MILAVGIIIATALTILLALGTYQLGCTPVSSALEAVPPALIVGVLAGCGYGLSIGVALVAGGGRRLLGFVGGGVALGVASLATVYIFFLVFPTGTCAP